MPEPQMVRSNEQVAREKAMGEVSDVLLNIDHTLDRAKRARKKVAKDTEERNVELALDAAVTELEKIRKRLVQDTYFGSDALRLI